MFWIWNSRKQKVLSDNKCYNYQKYKHFGQNYNNFYIKIKKFEKKNNND